MKKTTNYILITVFTFVLVIAIVSFGYADQMNKTVDKADNNRAMSTFFANSGLGPEAQYSVNNIIRFGRYEQDNIAENGYEDIEWIILDVKEDKALLISKNVLDCRQYDEDSWLHPDWEQSDLRSWLNHGFFQTAFSKEEQNAILQTDVAAEANPYANEPNQENNTKDKIFLISLSEYEKYFPNNTGVCKPSDFAQRYGSCTDVSSGTENASWWLRTTGTTFNVAVSITGTGFPAALGRLKNVDGGVRPAMWISLDKQEGSDIVEKETTGSGGNKTEQSVVPNLPEIQVDRIRLVSGQRDLTPEHAWPTIHVGESLTIHAEIYANTASKLDVNWAVYDFSGETIQYVVNEDNSITITCIGTEIKNVELEAFCYGKRQSIMLYPRA